MDLEQHARLQAVLSVSVAKLLRRVRADGDDLHTPPFELGPKLFPSPQLGDTVGSPMRPEEFYEYEMVVKTA